MSLLHREDSSSPHGERLGERVKTQKQKQGANRDASSRATPQMLRENSAEAHYSGIIVPGRSGTRAEAKPRKFKIQDLAPLSLPQSTRKAHKRAGRFGEQTPDVKIQDVTPFNRLLLFFYLT